MAASTTTRPATRTGGLALLVGVILLVLASVLFPGGPVLDRVDQTDFPAALDAMAGNPSLAHLASMISIVGMFLYAYTALTWLRLPQHGGLGASALRLGVFASLFGWSLSYCNGDEALQIHLAAACSPADRVLRKALPSVLRTDGRIIRSAGAF